MPDQIMSLELKRLFLESVFLRLTLWAGLSTRSFDIPPTLATLTASEPKEATGYARQIIQPANWTIAEEPLRVESDIAVFRNGSENRWPALATWFLATSQGSDGVLLAWGTLQEQRYLMAQDTLRVPISVIYPPEKGEGE